MTSRPKKFRLQSAALLDYLPPIPQSLDETGLPFGVLQDLVLRRLFLSAQISGLELSYSLHLPYTGVVDKLLEMLRTEKLVEFTGGPGFGRPYFDYLLTSKGRERAREAFERCTYVGPAPVPLSSYATMVKKQNQTGPHIGKDELARAFHDLVLEESFLERLGPAVNSVRSMFLYGPPGNGKTSVAERIANTLLGEVFVPFCLEVDAQLIQVFDPLVHHEIEPLPEVSEGFEAPPPEPSSRGATVLPALSGLPDIEEGATLLEAQLPGLSFDGDEDTAGKAGHVLEVPAWDTRWALSYRPKIVVGGELTLENLDLTYNPGKFYEAPYQVKSCAGMLLIDDFGRQKVDPTDLLNRWIVPLEKKVDFMTLKTGKKFEVPFDLLVIFSTNIDPARLVDEAFLRRIRYKLEIPDPTETTFRAIFSREAERQGVYFNPSILDYILQRYYRSSGRHMRGCHPRDILQLVVDQARFLKVPPETSRKLVDQACESYFVHMEGDDATKPGAAPLPSRAAPKKVESFLKP